MEPNLKDFPIQKKIIYAGNKYVDFKDGAKLTFHFQTRLCDAEKTVVDDSKKMGDKKPLTLVLGKKFKLEVWEVILKQMAVNEVSSFVVDKTLVTQYVFVSKTLRDNAISDPHKRTHCCAATLQNEGVGYKDLNEIMKNPCDLEFVMELLKVELPEEYEKEAWQMSEEEKLNNIPLLKQKGNDLYNQKKYQEASQEYAQAIGLLEQLMIKEKPHDIEWNELNNQKMPLLLNFSQCKLHMGEYYPVIEHCTTVLNHDSDNVKALFRRGKAHIGAWNPEAAQKDFERVMQLDPSLMSVVQKELRILEDLRKKRDDQDKAKLKNLFK